MNATNNSFVKGVLLTAVVLLAGSAFAASKGSMELLKPATVAGTQLPAGNYTVQWDGQGDQVQLQIFKGKKAITSASAHVVKLEHPLPENSVVVTPNTDGSRSISRINFGKKDFALELSDEGAGSGASGGAAK
ncbi:MAG TPA: hypothetical protein VL349_00350 [Terriglobales bacterium]|nr:hypothetical protein [Terriglobales bacterium]